MKKLIKYIVSFIKDDFNPWSYGITFIFMCAIIWFNYAVNFEHKVLDSYYKKPPLGMIYYFLFYASIYYFVAVMKMLVEKKKLSFP